MMSWFRPSSFLVLVLVCMVGLNGERLSASPPPTPHFNVTNNTGKRICIKLGTGMAGAYGEWYSSRLVMETGTTTTFDYHGAFYCIWVTGANLEYDACNTNSAQNWKTVCPANNLFWCQGTLNKPGVDCNLVFTGCN